MRRRKEKEIFKSDMDVLDNGKIKRIKSADVENILPTKIKTGVEIKERRRDIEKILKEGKSKERRK